jgi:hypothetical protein
VPFAKRMLCVCGALAAVIVLSSPIFGQGGSDAVIVHVSDPHLFVDNKTDDATKRQRENNVKAFDGVMTWLGTLPGDERSTRALVLTGDVDADPCWLRNPPPDKTPKPPVDGCIKDADKTISAEQVDRLATPLAASPIRDVYVIPGNNDVAYEQAGDAALKYYNDFMDAVQKQIAAKGSSVRLHNLGRCYAGDDDAQCYADVAGTSYRLLAFPSYSFKNREEANSYVVNAPIQDRQVTRFMDLVAKARAAGKKVIVLTHVAEIDDPFTMANDLFSGTLQQPQGPAVPSRSKWSTWGVSQAVFNGWRDAVASDTVAAVLAGHLHDSHKEIYRQPYAWAPVNPYRNVNKLFLAPPLAIKKQEGSPIQARGFSLVRLLPDRVERQLYWLDPQAGTFAADYQPPAPEMAHAGWQWLKEHALKCLKLINPCTSLDRFATWFIALLSAYLTVVQVWQIPVASNPLTETPEKKDDTKATATSFDPSPFASNFGKTVVTGLGGLAADAILKSFGTQPDPAGKQFYIAWFVALFFFILGLFAFIRGGVEAIRARVAVVYYTPARPPLPFYLSNWQRFIGPVNYWIYRFARWVFSWRAQLLTMVDTFINLVQGRNQTRTQLFAEVIIEQHKNVLRVAGAIRDQLNRTIETRLRAKNSSEPVVRVNISVLSADQSIVFYIARTPGSAAKTFIKRSVAWVSVFTGKIRWYKDTYFDRKDKIILFDNSSGLIADDEKLIHLGSHYQDRSQDYNAFVVIPVPWPQRSFGSRYVKGAIHISFGKREDFELLWNVEDPLPKDADKDKDKEVAYTSENKVLEKEWCDDDVVRTALLDAVNVLGELLRGFNENIYLNTGGADQNI